MFKPPSSQIFCVFNLGTIRYLFSRAPWNFRYNLTMAAQRAAQIAGHLNYPRGMLAGQVAIITGSGQGIGAEAARLFANEGAKVVVQDIDAGTFTNTVAFSILLSSPISALSLSFSIRLHKLIISLVNSKSRSCCQKYQREWRQSDCGAGRYVRCEIH